MQGTSKRQSLIHALFAVALIGAMLGSMTSVVNAQTPSGIFRGGWQSDTTGHRGPMNVRIRAMSNGDYRALFSGRFAGIIPFVYRAKLESTGMPGHFVSERQLPLMGTYRMTAVVNESGFYARYTSRKDVGSFQMRRVGHPMGAR